MSDLLSLVTPHTVGIIWFPKSNINFQDTHYKDIDYLLNGLLTASFEKLRELTSQVLVGKNFHHQIYVFYVNQLDSKELNSFFSLFEKNFKLESNILVLDDNNQFNELQKMSPKELISHYQLIKL
ncbi:MAG: hypothetical protein AB7I27_04205 [Bacteriovoracaceae bacterium]